MSANVAILAACVLVPLSIWWFRKRASAPSKVLGKELPVGVSRPMRLSLVPDAREPSVELKERVDTLSRLGFESSGRFIAEEAAGLHVVTMTHPQERAAAFVYEDIDHGCHTECIVFVDPVGSITVSNAPGVSAAIVRPGHRKVSLAHVSEAVVFRRLQDEVALEKRRFVAPQSVRSLFEKHYADEMAWHRHRSGATYDELRQLVAQPADGPFSAEEIEEARRALDGAG